MPAPLRGLAAALLCALMQGQANTCGSIALSGSDAVLTVASPPIYFPGDFTVEFWANPDSVTGSNANRYPRCFSLYPSGASAYTDSDIEVALVGSSMVVLLHGVVSVVGPYPGAGQWAHYAVVRAGATLSFFVQGSLAGSSSVSGAIGSSTSVLRVGGYDPAYASDYSQWQGKIADFRVVQGVALYSWVMGGAVGRGGLACTSHPAPLQGLLYPAYGASHGCSRHRPPPGCDRRGDCSGRLECRRHDCDQCGRRRVIF